MRRFLPYFKYLKPVRSTLAGAIVCGILYGVLNGAGFPFMVKYVIPRIFDKTAARLTGWQLVGLAAWLPLIMTLRAAAGYLNSYLIQLSGVRILESIRVDFFRKLQELPLAFYHRMSTGDLIARGLGDTNQLQNTLTTIATDIFKQPATLLSAIGGIAYLAFREQGVPLVLACLAIVPLCVFPIRYVGKKLISRTAFLQSQGGNITDRLSENLAAVKDVRAFGLEERENRRFAEVSAVLVRAQMKVAKYALALTPSIEILSAFGISFTLIYAYRTHVSLGAFLAIITALYMSYDPIKRIGALNNELKRGSAALHRLEEVLREPVSIADPEHAVEVGRFRGEIAFSGVNFSYKEGEPALRGISVKIPAGTVCALVGPSGAGKTTFANLVPRFYEVGSGAITVDGIDLRRMRLRDLRRNIAFVPQEPVLFNETIFNNLRLGREDATPDQVRAAAIDANAHEFICALPQGYDTLVGERGSLLSGGQKQRVAVARAFLRNAPILILDEATSALDSESEAAIQRALKKLMAGKTVLIIAHRFSTIRDASMILVFDRGEIVATGGHGELYLANPLYRTLYNRQQGRGS